MSPFNVEMCIVLERNRVCLTKSANKSLSNIKIYAYIHFICLHSLRRLKHLIPKFGIFDVLFQKITISKTTFNINK